MDNLIRLEHVKSRSNISNLVITENDLALAKSNERYVQYVNPSQIVNIRTRWFKLHSNGKEYEFNIITFSSGEAILTTYTVEQILEKIEGKPKK